MFPPVLSKADFVRRFLTGEFGNRTRNWDTLDEFTAWVATHDPHERYQYNLRNRVAGGATYYNLYWSECVARWLEQEDKSAWYVGQMITCERQTIQGEVYYSDTGLTLYYTDVKKPMRTALAEKAKQVSGIIAWFLLRHYLCPNSFDWLRELFDRYPDHVVEFSSFERRGIGTLPNYNTIFWEVRKY